MIFLFSNRGYGGPFVRSAAGYARRTGAAITAVRSGRGDRERRLRGTRAGPLRELMRRWRSAHDREVGALRTITVDDVNDRSFVESIAPDDVGIIAGFDQIFSVEAIARFRSLVNFHPSLLPYYRGPDPAFWCLDGGETATGFTIHSVTRRIDSGEIHHQEALPIDPHDTAVSLEQRIASIAQPAFERWLDHVSGDTPWTKRILASEQIYRRLVDYKSFPPHTAPVRSDGET